MNTAVIMKAHDYVPGGVGGDNDDYATFHCAVMPNNTNSEEVNPLTQKFSCKCYSFEIILRSPLPRMTAN